MQLAASGVRVPGPKDKEEFEEIRLVVACALDTRARLLRAAIARNLNQVARSQGMTLREAIKDASRDLFIKSPGNLSLAGPERETARRAYYGVCSEVMRYLQDVGRWKDEENWDEIAEREQQDARHLRFSKWCNSEHTTNDEKLRIVRAVLLRISNDVMHSGISFD